MSTGIACPLCNRDGFDGDFDSAKSTWAGDCAACGSIHVTGRAISEARAHKVGNYTGDRFLSLYFRRLSARLPAPVTADNFMEVISSVPRLTISEKLDALLAEVAKQTPYFGAKSTFEGNRDHFAIGCLDSEEAYALVNAAQDAALIATAAHPRLTLSGMARVEESRNSGALSDRVFVAMSFSAEQRAVFTDVIKPVVEDAGYRPFRVDFHEHVNSINDEIVAGIRGSRFMVADFTGQRAGVYFEAGMMFGLNRHVFWMCHDEDMRNVHFDTRQYNFINYVDLEDAKTRLFNRILAVEGRGPNAATQ